MNRSEIIATQTAVGTVPDGFWGPKSIAACRAHLARLMPVPHPWPASDQGSLSRFYGRPGDEGKLVNLDVTGVGVKYFGQPVRSVRCHHRVAESLGRVLRCLAKTHPEVIANYAGCYNHRKMRGGSLPSLHARGAAIDLDPGRNGNRTSWPVGAKMPLSVMEAFAREGWLPAGAFWGRDAMHFQATR